MKSTPALRNAEFDVAVDARRLDRSEGGTIAGPLAVRLESAWFPERSWSDFPVIVLGWWLRECAALSTGGNGRFRFMDGPFQFNAYKKEVGRVELEWDEGNLASEPVLGAVVPIEHIRLAVRRSAVEILAECDRRNWSGRDIDVLRVLVESAPA